MIKLTNPIDRDLKILFKGDEEILEAKETRIVNDDLGLFWISLHTFLIKEDVVAKDKVEEIVEEVTNEIVEEKPEEVIAKKKNIKSKK